MTVPRELALQKLGAKYLITSQPVKELNTLTTKSVTLRNVAASNYNLTEKSGKMTGPARLTFKADKLEPFNVTLSNDAGEKVVIGYDEENNYFIDRTSSGKIDFEKGFGGRHIAPRFSANKNMDITLIIDNASVELFADGGLS